MKSTGLQFHATRSDIYLALACWAEDLEMTVVGEVFFPDYALVELSSSELRDASSHSSKIDRVSLQPGDVDLDLRSDREFLDRHPNGLSVLVGERRGEFMYEALLGARTADEEAIKTWRRLRGELKRSMEKGAWIVNSWSGHRSRDDNHPYTLAARELQNSGVTMVGQTEVVHYLLD